MSIFRKSIPGPPRRTDRSAATVCTSTSNWNIVREWSDRTSSLEKLPVERHAIEENGMTNAKSTELLWSKTPPFAHAEIHPWQDKHVPEKFPKTYGSTPLRDSSSETRAKITEGWTSPQQFKVHETSSLKTIHVNLLFVETKWVVTRWRQECDLQWPTGRYKRLRGNSNNFPTPCPVTHVQDGPVAI